MAKGQKRSTREIRKPKKEKVPVKAPDAFGSQVKLTSNTQLGKANKK
jgi:hypothetical protein